MASSLPKPMVDPALNEDFVRLLAKHEARVFSYIFALLPNSADAEEVLQETSVVIWRKFHAFELGSEFVDSDFVSWACRIAYYEVLRFRRDRRTPVTNLSSEFVEAVAVQRGELDRALVDRREALAHCIQRLNPRDRDLVERRYLIGLQVKEIAGAFNRPISSISRSLSRVRRALSECVNRTLGKEARV